MIKVCPICGKEFITTEERIKAVILELDKLNAEIGLYTIVISILEHLKLLKKQLNAGKK